MLNVAILLYDRLTALDAMGPYEVLSRLRDARVTFVAEQPGPVTTDTGMLSLVAEKSLAEVPHPDLLLVPGGPGQEQQLTSEPVLDWLRTADAASSWTTSVCTGSLILAAAGLLEGRRATSHWLALDRLADFGALPTAERVVIDGKYVTGAGVSAGIDMALTLAGRIGGQDAAQAIQLMLEYAPEPPYHAGSPRTAPADLVARLRIGSRHTTASKVAG